MGKNVRPSAGRAYPSRRGLEHLQGGRVDIETCRQLHCRRLSHHELGKWVFVLFILLEMKLELWLFREILYLLLNCLVGLVMVTIMLMLHPIFQRNLNLMAFLL